MPVTATAYTYDELEDDAKIKAIYTSRNITTDFDFEWWDQVYEDWIPKLAEMGYETDAKHMWFSGFWSQGDGACFEASVDVLKWLEQTDSEIVDFRSLRYWLKKLGIEAAHVRIYHQGHYYHRHTMYIEAEWSEWTAPPKAQNQLEDAALAILEHAKEQALALYRDLESTCEDMMSDDYIKDFLQINEYLFWSDGTPAHFK